MIEIRDLIKTYDRGGERVVACSVDSLAVDRGEQVAIVGRSGLGKTTLLHMVAGITRPDRGTLRVCGQDVDRMSEPARDRFRADHIGMVFQTLNLLQPFTALENVTLGAVFGGRNQGDTQQRAEHLLDRCGLGDRRSHRPSQLSVGQAQRVAICRALINEPELILADEPLGNQDRQTGEEVLELLLELANEGNRSVLMVTHDPESAKRMQRTVDLQEVRGAS